MRCIRILVLITNLFLVGSASAITLDFDGAEYVATTAEKCKVAWSPSTIDANVCADCEYEVRIHHAERKTYHDLGTTTGLEYQFTLPRTGHYWPEVRGCRVTRAERQCSDWASTVAIEDRPLVNGAVKLWRIYGRPASVGEIIVTK